MDEDDEDDPSWSLEDVFTYDQEESTYPNGPTTIRLVEDMWSMWNSAPPRVEDMMHWAFASERLDLVDLPHNGRTIRTEHVEGELKRHKCMLLNLRQFLTSNDIDPREETYMMLENMDRLFQELQSAIRTCSNVVALSNAESDMLRNASGGSERKEEPSFMNHDPKDTNKHQKCFLHLVTILQKESYRRCGNSYYKRVYVGGFATLAFEKHVEIQTYLLSWCTVNQDFKQWAWLTDSKQNQAHVVHMLTTHPVYTTPDLVENRHLRSYGGDQYGRGSGVYDCKSDMFFPYAHQGDWKDMASRVQEIRRRVHDPEYECVAPNRTDDVALLHLKHPFPYDVYAEVEHVGSRHLHLRWRTTQSFECMTNETKGDRELCIPGVVEKLFALPLDNRRSGRVGTRWEVVGTLATNGILLENDDLQNELITNGLEVSETVLDRIGVSIKDNHYVQSSEKDFYFMPALDNAVAEFRSVDESDWEEWTKNVRVGYHTVHVAFFKKRNSDGSMVDMKREVHFHVTSVDDEGIVWERFSGGGGFEQSNTIKIPGLSDHLYRRVTNAPYTMTWQTWSALCSAIPSDTFVKVVANDTESEAPSRTQYLRMYTGRSWQDCESHSFDHIFFCQKFTSHDLFWVYALLGRLFFHVREMDNYEMCLFLEGTGGCGKSTVYRLWMMFWPRHLCKILSSNMQEKFGAGELADAAVAFCTEVSKQMGMPQEEWQNALSGEAMSLNKKHEGNINVDAWKVPFAWAGNAFPECYNNDQNQVTRRLAGCRMYEPVTKRDGKLMDRLIDVIGVLQRKAVLAYFEFLRQYSPMDPMSDQANMPPAFREFQIMGKIKVNPLESLLADKDIIEKGDEYSMLLDKLRKLFEEYRKNNGLQKSLRWDRDTYFIPFTNHGLRFEKKVPTFVDEDGMEHSNVDVVYGIRRRQD
jgi:hypothetical protein